MRRRLKAGVECPAFRLILVALFLLVSACTAPSVTANSPSMEVGAAAIASPQQEAQAATPSIGQPPPGTLPCDGTNDSGGQGVTRNKLYLGDKPGMVETSYNLYIKPDDIKVFYRGRLLAGTGGPRYGRGKFSFEWRPVAGDFAVEVVVTGELSGTRWTYSMSCPRDAR